MIRMSPGNLSFQTFYVSREQSNCPLISYIVRIGKKFKEIGLLENTIGIISLGYGKRVIINGNDVDLADLKREEILEIVDYDPVKKIVLAIGQKEPCNETPVHWLIHNARDDVNAIIQLNNEKLAQKLVKKLPATEKEQTPGSLELAKDVLKVLRNSKNIVIKNVGVLFVGSSLKEAEDSALMSIGDVK